MAAESGPISREKNLKSRTGRRGDAPIGTTRRAPETATGRAGGAREDAPGTPRIPRAERSEHGAELSWGNGAGVGTEGVSAWGGWRMRERENDGPGVPAAPAQATLRLRGLVDENAPPRLA